MAKRGRLRSDLGYLIVPHKQCFLTEGVDEDHSRVSVVAVGWGARLGELVLGRQGGDGVSWDGSPGGLS